MTTAAQPSDRLRQRISRWEQGDPEGVLADEALIEAAQLWRKFTLEPADKNLDFVVQLLGWLHWARGTSGPEGQRALERKISLLLFQLLWQRNPEATPSALRTYFRDAKPDPIEDPKEHVSGILRDIAAIVITEKRDTGIRLYDLSEWPPDLPPEHSALPLLRVAEALASRYGETGDVADLDAAVSYGERAVAMAPDPGELRANVLQDVSVVLCGRFEVTAAMSDSDRVIALLNEAVEIARSLGLSLVVLLTNRSLARVRRFVAFHQLTDLQQAEADGAAALAALPPRSPRRAAVAAHLTMLSQLLAAHPGDEDLDHEDPDFDVRQDPAKLWAAIESERSAIMTAWPDANVPGADIGLLPLLNLRAHQNLRRRIHAAQATGNAEFVLSAEAMTDAAYLWWIAQRLTARDSASSRIPQACEILGEFHIQRHNATVSTRRPDELVQTMMYWWAAPEAVRDSLRDPLDRLIGPAAEPELQTRYAGTLIHYARQEYNPALVKAAILLLTDAVEATGADDPDLPERLSQLSDAYLARGQGDDFDIAAELAADAVALVPADHPEAGQYKERLNRARSRRLRHTRRPISPDPVGNSMSLFVMRQEYLGTPKGAESAAEMDALVQKFVADAPQKAESSHSKRFLREYQRDGLAVSLELALIATEAETPGEDAGSTTKLNHLLHLGEIHHERYLLTQNAADLAETSRLLQEALTVATPFGPIRASIVNGLAMTYTEQLQTEGRTLDDARLEELCLTARSTPADALSTVRALRGVGRLCLRHERYDLAATCYREAVAMLRFLVLEEIDREDRAARLTQFTEVGSEAVTALLLAGDPHGALELAEEARAVLLSLDLDLRSDLSELRATRPDLADRFDRQGQALTAQQLDEVRTPAGYVRVARGAHSRDAWAALLRDIRKVPGHEDFLRPPRAAELTGLGLPGPLVLINVSEFGGHALIVGGSSDVRAVPLTGLTAKDVRSHALDLLASAASLTREVLGRTLTWLWDTMVGPVLKATGPATRVWWVPTGLITVFPLHAAVSPTGQCTLDLIDSSYAPTIRLLSRNMARATTPQPGSDLIVAVRRAAAGAELPGAEAEGRALLDRLPQAVALLNDAATRERVLSALPQATRAYFACHNLRDDARPHLSGLGLFDGLLTIDDLSRLDLPNAEFAQLSACATVMPTPDAPDELTHLAAAFQLAGFRSVVATLWPVRDQIAAEFSQLLHDTGSVTAAARTLRHRYPDRPDDWAAFLQYGP
ncbi:CHAT domain-containing protein [Streptomyces longwoodensis]|uniref:CHAT domain-containing protein n=1 Tax=Streptomyces longwoodensis TaxID=68231 RepID=UPI002E80C5AC|nr:CHAT domain-containing protein [Streptomyces longwoodensis]WUC55612.1 CHAT domain-containing protein [Streptomyces longwoodensis]WUC62270.1 CHAT domain-containing protein [Streptomyces longwoodensis]